jgi:hypothetical protein
MFSDQKTEQGDVAFIAARALYQRGAPLARTCGAKLRSGAACSQLALSGEARCLRHGGPFAAKRHRARQLAGLETGSVSPDEWARAEQQRARNALSWAWRVNPRLPGRTVDLGPHEAAFVASAQAAGVDVGALYPAVADWLRWRWQRHHKDRPNATRWQQVVGVELARRMAQADAALRWQMLGGLDRRTKAGKAVAAALRAGGYDAAVGLAARLRADLDGARVVSGPAGGAGDGLPLPDVRPWVAGGIGKGWKRRLPDRPKARQADGASSVAAPTGPGRPKQLGRTVDEVAALASVLFSVGPEVRAMFAAIPLRHDQLRFLRDLQAVNRAPNDAGARKRWMDWVGTIKAG